MSRLVKSPKKGKSPAKKVIAKRSHHAKKIISKKSATKKHPSKKSQTKKRPAKRTVAKVKLISLFTSFNSEGQEDQTCEEAGQKTRQEVDQEAAQEVRD